MTFGDVLQDRFGTCIYPAIFIFRFAPAKTQSIQQIEHLLDNHVAVFFFLGFQVEETGVNTVFLGSTGSALVTVLSALLAAFFISFELILSLLSLSSSTRRRMIFWACWAASRPG